MKTLTLAVLLLTGLQAAEKAPDAKTPPAISPELRAQYWRARAEFIAISAQHDALKAKLDTATGELIKTCGDSHQANFDGKTGEPICEPKPTPKVEAAKAPTK